MISENCCPSCFSPGKRVFEQFLTIFIYLLISVWKDSQDIFQTSSVLSLSYSSFFNCSLKIVLLEIEYFWQHYFSIPLISLRTQFVLVFVTVSRKYPRKSSSSTTDWSGFTCSCNMQERQDSFSNLDLKEELLVILW